MLKMSSSKREIYENARARWPQMFRIIWDVSSATSVITDPSDFEAYRAVEESIGLNDEWSQLSAWAFNQALGNIIDEYFSDGKSLILTKAVPFEVFDKKMKSNLAHDCWQEERLIYERLP